MNLLALETSTDRLSIAVLRENRMHETNLVVGNRHAELVLPSIEALLAEAGLSRSDLDGIAFGAGPGAFTGLRVACSVAQGLAAALEIGVIGVNALETLAEQCGGPRVIACLDARMGEVYHAAYERETTVWREVVAPGVCTADAMPRPPGRDWIGCGSGFVVHGNALRARLDGSLARVVEDVFPTAAAMLRLAAPRFERGEALAPEAAYPLYVRDKVALTVAERR